ncbi:amidohydrolase family protein [Microbacterium hominis]|uniref:Amidohydrolase n=1 Tax=Microbacterium hominis TaxID=162426 RepID=A0A7D4TS34_9MICO|nr:amidohydrolase family protein [Microbacterium hominis]QKJ20484.1 amidohydrolase [Microbacterium hominis]
MSSLEASGSRARGSSFAEIRAHVDALALVDHHIHSVFAGAVDADLFASALAETAAVAGPRVFDSPLGMAVRQHCAPLLGLPAFCTGEDYVAQRRRLGEDAVDRTLLRAAGVERMLVDGGYAGDRLRDDATLAEMADARVERVVRLEAVAEQVVRGAMQRPGGDLLETLHRELERQSAGAVGFKSVAAYRTGLALPPAPPPRTEVAAAAHAFVEEARRSGRVRLADPVLIHHLLWWAVADGRPLQLHVGLGDPDLVLRRANPLLLQEFLHATAALPTRIMLLHCYPFHRDAGSLAHMYPHVYVDVGLAITHLGAGATAVVRESMELTPFDRLLYSSDAWGLSERVYLGARLWRDATATVLAERVADGWPLDEALRLGAMIGRDNARAAYGPASPPSLPPLPEPLPEEARR